jgi:hypothetical protein
LIEIAAVAGGRGSGASPTAALNAMRLPIVCVEEVTYLPEFVEKVRVFSWR